MSESTKLMSFEEFRAADGETFGEVVRQQRAFFRDEAAGNAMLEPGAVPLGGWIEWPGAAMVDGWPVWEGNATAVAKA